jgi:hypothetical protein
VDHKEEQLDVNVLLLLHIRISVIAKVLLVVGLRFKHGTIIKGQVYLIIVGSLIMDVYQVEYASALLQLLEAVLVLWMVLMLHVLTVIL